MIFEVNRISEHNYQMFTIDEHGQRRWLASFNGLSNLITYYIHCHNLTFDELEFTGTEMLPYERKLLYGEDEEWGIIG